MSRSNPALAFLLLLTLVGPASAHPDYEQPLTIVKGAHGEDLTVVLHYTDGIVASDPVKIQVYDAAGRVVTETPYARAYVPLEAADGPLYVFAVSDFGLAFWQGWKLDQGTLTPLPAAAYLGLAIFANLRAHWLAYGFSTLLCWAAATIYFRRARKAANWRIHPGWLAYGAIIWLLVIIVYGNLSILMIAALTILGLLPVLTWARHDSAKNY